MPRPTSARRSKLKKLGSLFEFTCTYCKGKNNIAETLEPMITVDGCSYHIECYEKKYGVSVWGFSKQLGLRI